MERLKLVCSIYNAAPSPGCLNNLQHKLLSWSFGCRLSGMNMSINKYKCKMKQ